MFSKERDKWMGLLSTEREAHRKERQELLNRITGQTVVDVSDEPHEAQPMTLTDLELSFVGGTVPDGVSVGSLRSADE